MFELVATNPCFTSPCFTNPYFTNPCFTNPCFTNSCFTNPVHVYKSNPVGLLQYAPGNRTILANGKGFPEFHSERKKRTTSGGCPQFPKGFSGKLPFHLTSNRNFRIFWINGGCLQMERQFSGKCSYHLRESFRFQALSHKIE